MQIRCCIIWCELESIWPLGTEGQERQSVETALRPSFASVAMAAPQKIKFWSVGWSPSSVLNSQGNHRADGGEWSLFAYPQSWWRKNWWNNMYLLCSSKIRTRLCSLGGFLGNEEAQNSSGELCVDWMVLLLPTAPLPALSNRKQNYKWAGWNDLKTVILVWSQRKWLNLHQFRKTLAERCQQDLKMSITFDNRICCLLYSVGNRKVNRLSARHFP